MNTVMDPIIATGAVSQGITLLSYSQYLHVAIRLLFSDISVRIIIAVRHTQTFPALWLVGILFLEFLEVHPMHTSAEWFGSMHFLNP